VKKCTRLCNYCCCLDVSDWTAGVARSYAFKHSDDTAARQHDAAGLHCSSNHGWWRRLDRPRQSHCQHEPDAVWNQLLRGCQHHVVNTWSCCRELLGPRDDVVDCADVGRIRRNRKSVRTSYGSFSSLNRKIVYQYGTAQRLGHGNLNASSLSRHFLHATYGLQGVMQNLSFGGTSEDPSWWCKFSLIPKGKRRIWELNPKPKIVLACLWFIRGQHRSTILPLTKLLSTCYFR